MGVIAVGVSHASNSASVSHAIKCSRIAGYAIKGEDVRGSMSRAGALNFKGTVRNENLFWYSTQIGWQGTLPSGVHTKFSNATDQSVVFTLQKPRLRVQ